jgi:amino-acid N-acetyltransferase
VNASASTVGSRDAVMIRPATPADQHSVHELVAAAGLPTDGLNAVWRSWIAVMGAQPVGTASLERHGNALLLRSVAVSPRWQGTGIGARLVAQALAAAADIGPVALLTTTAADWFTRHGFVPVPRNHLDPALASSPELQKLCPDSAAALMYDQTAQPTTFY